MIIANPIYDTVFNQLDLKTMQLDLVTEQKDLEIEELKKLLQSLQKSNTISHLNLY